MPKFRRKPLIVDAEQFRPAVAELPFQKQQVCRLDSEGWYIQTMESQRFSIKDGDWIVRGVAGEFYVCDQKMFDLLYAPVQGPFARLDDMVDQEELSNRLKG